MAIKCVSYFDRMDANKRKSFVSCSGSHIMTIYEYRFVDGIKQLVPSGKTDTQELIDSFAESADINNIIVRFLNGDESVINKVVGTFGDFRDCPTTYAEMFDRIQKCENLFNSMPVEIKEKFDNSYEKFWSSFGSEYFDDVFKSYNTSSIETPIEDLVIEKEVATDAK